jgi:hypothetical protein
MLVAPLIWPENLSRATATLTHDQLRFRWY